MLTFALGRPVEVRRPAADEAGLDGVSSGREAHVAEALARLELIADTYLSVSTPVQLAAGSAASRQAAGSVPPFAPRLPGISTLAAARRARIRR